MILVVGLSHKTAPVEVRERLSAGAEALPVVLSRLAARQELQEVMFLSTCNRVEVLALAQRRSASSPRCARSARSSPSTEGSRRTRSSRRTSTTSAATRR